MKSPIRYAMFARTRYLIIPGVLIAWQWKKFLSVSVKTKTFLFERKKPQVGTETDYGMMENL